MADHDRPDFCKETQPMIGVPAALAAVLFIGGMMVIAAFLLFSPAITEAVNRPVNSLQRDENGDHLLPRNNEIAPVFSTEVKRWEAQITAWAVEWNLDANLIATVMQIESCGDSHAVSRSGALGLFQVMPYHFQPGEDAFDPQTNARRGLAYLRQAYDARQGNVFSTLASYNGGIYGASQPQTAWPEETQRYAHWGIGIYDEARSGIQSSPTLEAWMSAGGISLCAQAGQSLASNEDD